MYKLNKFSIVYFALRLSDVKQDDSCGVLHADSSEILIEISRNNTL